MIKPAPDTWTISSCIIALALILLPPVQNAASAATYYVAKTGNNAYTCAQALNTATPKLTITGATGGIACMAAGDVLYIRTGTYNEHIDSSAQTLPTGTSWANAPIISSYPGETATVLQGVGLTDTYAHYMSFENLVFDGQNKSDVIITVGMNVTAPHHIQFKNCEVKNAAHHGVVFFGTGGFNIFTGGSVHHIGNVDLFPRSQWGHYGMYISSHDNVIEDTEIHHTNDYGIHTYNGVGGTNDVTSRNIYRFNVFHHNALLRPSGAALLVSVGDNFQIYNNIFYSESGHGIAVGTSKPVLNAQIYNNTIYNVAQSAVNVLAASGTIIRNNIMYLNRSTIIDGGTGTIQDHNLTTNPLFVNAAAFNFNLQTSSPAIDAGVTLSQVTTDFKNTPRPQGGAYDIGAYEGGVSSDIVPPQRPVGLVIR